MSEELNSPFLPLELQLAAFVVFLCVMVTIITMLSVFWLLSNLYDKGVFEDAPIISVEEMEDPPEYDTFDGKYHGAESQKGKEGGDTP